MYVFFKCAIYEAGDEHETHSYTTLIHTRHSLIHDTHSYTTHIHTQHTFIHDTHSHESTCINKMWPDIQMQDPHSYKLTFLIHDSWNTGSDQQKIRVFHLWGGYVNLLWSCVTHTSQLLSYTLWVNFSHTHYESTSLIHTGITHTTCMSNTKSECFKVWSIWSAYIHVDKYEWDSFIHDTHSYTTHIHTQHTFIHNTHSYMTHIHTSRLVWMKWDRIFKCEIHIYTSPPYLHESHEPQGDSRQWHSRLHGTHSYTSTLIDDIHLYTECIYTSPPYLNVSHQSSSMLLKHMMLWGGYSQ